MNLFGRYYLLSFLTQIRCIILRSDPDHARGTIIQEERNLRDLATTTFNEVLGKSPEIYLHPALAQCGITLDVLAEVYQQARLAGAIEQPKIDEASQLFEHLRCQVAGLANTLFAPRGKVLTNLVARMNYLISCLEEINRIHSLRHRIDHAQRNNLSLKDLEQECKVALDHSPKEEAPPTEPRIFAWAMA